MAEKIDYELTAAEAALLDTAMEEGLERAGELGGAIGGAIGGAVGGGAAGGAPGAAGGAAGGRTGGAAGGRKGGRFGARFTKAQTAEVRVEVQHDPDGARERARTAIAETGEVIEDPNAADDGSVWGIVGSGVKDMVPAIVRVGVEAGGSGSRVHVRATGKEGLIKQRIGAKAADRIAEALAQG